MCCSDVRFSNRPFGVKHFQTVRRCSVDVTHGLVLLFGIGTKALVWGFLSQAGRRIFSGLGLSVGSRQAGIMGPEKL
jgi:hypothetical protein